MEKTIKISNKQQIECLVNLMERNSDIGRGKSHYGSSRQDVKETWEQFASQLNSLGPPSRTGPEWQRVWVHYKANLKRKLAKNKENFLATGGGPSQEIILTSTEERVSELIKVNLSINPAGNSFGLNGSNSNNEKSSTAPNIDPPDVEAATPAPKYKRTKAEARLVLLEKQSKTQSEILRTLKKIEITKYKEYTLKKQKIKLMEKAEERKSVLRELRIKLAEEELKKLEKLM